MPALCRDCCHSFDHAKTGRCPNCASVRIIAHPELKQLSIAHIDCDAFYASVEKRDDPSLADRPVVVGGRKRGVVMAACYIARIRGVRSAMPMFQALKACPDAVVIPPDMEKYRDVGRQIRDMMDSLTPVVEPLSVDEAFLDLGGTETLHHAIPAESLARLIRRIETEVGVTASVGLSYNKFLAKTASDLDKPRGFSVIGRAEALEFLAPRPVGSIYGVGKSLANRLTRDGLSTVGQLRRIDEAALVAKYGSIGRRLARIARGEDGRRVDSRLAAKSVSAETTFSRDIADPTELSRRLWPLCEKVARRLKAGNRMAGAITLKIKTNRFQQFTRSKQLTRPTALAENLYQTALPLLHDLADGRHFRLIGLGTSRFTEADTGAQQDFMAIDDDHAAKVEYAIDAVREKFGAPAIFKGRSLRDQ